MQSHDYAFDARLEHRAVGQPALTAATTIVSRDQRAKTRTEFVTQFMVESIDVASGNEEYRFIVEVSNDNFATVETAAILSLGHTSARLGSGPSNAAGDMYQVPWCTEVNGAHYQSWRIRLETAGTSPSIALAVNSTWGA